MSATRLELTQDDLCARLAGGKAGEPTVTTVVTPNRRLAQALRAAFDHRQRTAGRTVWETADILPYGAFVERLYEDALYSELAATAPLLATPDEEQSLWEEIVRRSDAGSPLLAVPETAAAAREAWELAHSWGFIGGFIDDLNGPLADDDARAFGEWAGRYVERTGRERLTDRARLPAAVAASLDDPRVRKPGLLVAYGFDLVTPQQAALLDAFARRGTVVVQCGPERRDANVVRIAAADARDEMRQAANWARARLESNAGARIAIVVPDLAQCKSALRRVLAATLDPGRAGGVLPFNVSLGDPLAGFPLVAHALAALELAGGEVPFERASLVLRSPFIALAESELALRAGLDARIRRRAEPAITLDRLVELAGDAGELGDRLGAHAEFRKRRLFGVQSPADWARAFGDALAALGFPGQRGLSSAEYQTLQKWHEVLARFARLERVAPRMGFGAALGRLQRMAADTLFQPETPEVPIQVLGVLEAAGMAFDHLWVMGLADEAWPMPPRPNPFIPLRLQRAAGIPNASPAATLEFAQRLTAGWRACGGEVVLSHPQREADRNLAASPLIAAVPGGRLDLPIYDTWRDTIHGHAALERISDSQAPGLAAGAVRRGGARLLKDQSACAFRALAIHRLSAEGVTAPHTGLDGAERGKLVHRVLARVWGRLETRQALAAMPAPDLEHLLVEAAEMEIERERRHRPTTLAPRFAAIERARLARLAAAWLDHERSRSDFTVVAVEADRTVEVGPLALRLRLDRVDETAAGARIVIDYKTGKATLPSILRMRPDEPQLPLYATAAEPGAAAAAFAQVRAGEMKFVGLARDDGLLPGVKTPGETRAKSGAESSWDAQVMFWRTELDRLAGEFAAGHAAVDPKRGVLTCRDCGIQPFCRVHERLGGGTIGD